MWALALLIGATFSASENEQAAASWRLSSQAPSVQRHHLESVLLDSGQKVLFGMLDEQNWQQWQRAQADLESAKQSLKNLDIEAATQMLQKVIDSYQSFLATSRQRQELAQALSLLAACHIQLGNKKDARASIESLLNLERDYAPDEQVYSPPMMRFFDRIAIKFRKRKKFPLLFNIQSEQPVLVVIDGHAQGLSSAKMPRLSRGNHWLRAYHPTLGLAHRRFDFNPRTKRLKVALKPWDSPRGNWNQEDILAGLCSSDNPNIPNVAQKAALQNAETELIAVSCPDAEGATKNKHQVFVYTSAAKYLGRLNLKHQSDRLKQELASMVKAARYKEPAPIATFEFTGRVCGDGRPIGTAEIALTDAQGLRRVVSANSKGRFSIPSTKPGTAEITIKSGSEIIFSETRKLDESATLLIGDCGLAPICAKKSKKGLWYTGYGLSAASLIYGALSWSQAQSRNKAAQSSSTSQADAFALRDEALSRARQGDLFVGLGLAIGTGSVIGHSVESKRRSECHSTTAESP